MTQTTVQVVVRVKPKTNPTDTALTAVDSSDESDRAAIILKKEDEQLYEFNFTRVLSDIEQWEMYKICGREIVNNVVDGINGTILAYGQTGAGKTYTMTGPEDALNEKDYQGITPRAIKDIFTKLRSPQYIKKTIKVSYIEIYNEKFKDLLNPSADSNTISIIDKGGRISLKNVDMKEVSSVEETIQILEKGGKIRSSAAHGMNARSSRSHAVFTIVLDLIKDDGSQTVSKLNLVDLAGSERMGKTGAEGKVAAEAVHINKSLTFLEQVIKSLSDNKSSHVPYRQSKLTYFLKDSLGGNCKTVMVACVWGDAQQINETLSTCRFADRMMKVKVNASKNTVGGLQDVQGNLKRLDPKMRAFVAQMMAANAAETRAKVIRELQEQNGVGAGEYEKDMEELERLREYVEELGSKKVALPKQVDLGMHEEMLQALRQRVHELENEREQERDATENGNSEQYSREMEILRSKVAELQNNDLSGDKVKELEALRIQVSELQERERDLKAREEEQQRLLAERALQSRKSNRSEDFTDMLARLNKLLSNNGGDISDADKEQITALKARLVKLDGAELDSGRSGTAASGDASSVDNVAGTGSFDQQSVENTSAQPTDRTDYSDRSLPQQEAQQNRDTSQTPFAGSDAQRIESSRGDSASDEAQQWGNPANNNSSKSKSKWGKLFSRKKPKDPALEVTDQTEEEDGAPNIVILNSLTHDQLMDLLRAHNMSEEQGKWQPQQQGRSGVVGQKQPSGQVPARYM